MLWLHVKLCIPQSIHRTVTCPHSILLSLVAQLLNLRAHYLIPQSRGRLLPCSLLSTVPHPPSCTRTARESPLSSLPLLLHPPDPWIKGKPHCFDHLGVSEPHRCQDPSPGHSLPSADTHPSPPSSLVHPCCPLLSSVLLLTSTRYSSVTPHRPPTGANTLPQLTMEHFLSLKFRDQLCSTGEWGKSPAPPRNSWESRSLRVSDPCVSKSFVSLVSWLCASPGLGKATLSTQEILRWCPERAPLSLGWEPASLLAVANQESAWVSVPRGASSCKQAASPKQMDSTRS